MEFRSIYVHFPFCETKCHYCDFYSLGREKTRADDPALFLDALLTESGLWKNELNASLDSIFFGGGTPSMTPPSAMAQWIEKMDISRRIHANTEWTMEGNPSSLDLENLREYKKLGLNRVSMGVQALRDDHLKLLGRVHSRDRAFKALDSIFEAGIQNVSCDLLCGVPGQSTADIEKALNELTRYPLKHLSCYLLTLPKHHPLYSQLPSEDEQLGHLLFVDEWMTSHGFEHYEISNYAKPGHEARHNLIYWRGESYLGLGPSAHSYSKERKTRWKSFSSLARYSKGLSQESSTQKSVQEWEEVLTERQLELEKWMLALRLADGFPKEWLDTQSRKQKAELFLNEGLLIENSQRKNHLRLSPKGFALSESVIREFV